MVDPNTKKNMAADIQGIHFLNPQEWGFFHKIFFFLIYLQICFVSFVIVSLFSFLFFSTFFFFSRHDNRVSFFYFFSLFSLSSMHSFSSFFDFFFSNFVVSKYFFFFPFFFFLLSFFFTFSIFFRFSLFSPQILSNSFPFRLSSRRLLFKLLSLLFFFYPHTTSQFSL
ncbi:unnamed protein product [Acanthosepion pharaonis]|uniref:Uncharacterized protein n=1 Tax=Acanthosepion pharaonis TaxID=158019 RepID=A0A812EI95_ACAPH|nr:unnamed protein product [Sepia pharaonis]